MRKIYFATTNQGKIREARQILGIKIIPTPLAVDEVQSLDPVEVTTKKGLAYFEKLKKPVLVEDVSLVVKALGRLPGPYINDFLASFGNQGLTKMVGQPRGAVARTTLAFFDENGKSHLFSAKTFGQIAQKPRGKQGFGWDPIFIPRGSKKTFGEMTLEEKNKFSMRKKALLKFKNWLESDRIRQRSCSSAG